ncbi:hypothetical protein G3N95_00785 [Paraburkholderia sp. Tr-20389]|uniref:hypothetical protein n=1 Tax=Paraburkholderia sp. Tr-20389 TaxID=2703903 RepID=UPI00197E12EB|nr:hypothetical protein [Paraburkholderia sp. Tr-20389]MBN3751459.1 hypothetical protein [Paraburkholderia sp. Tr-20389]
MAPGDIVSPYSINNLDDAITHLERVIGAECAQTIFGKRYWHGRIQQLQATHGIMHTQVRRLRALVERLESAAPCAISPSHATRAR